MPAPSGGAAPPSPRRRLRRDGRARTRSSRLPPSTNTPAAPRTTSHEHVARLSACSRGGNCVSPADPLLFASSPCSRAAVRHMSTPLTRSRPPRRSPRSPVWRPALALLGLVAALLVGISIGRALEDGPSPGGTQTSVRTLEPQPLPPAARTVTVT